MIGLVKKNFEDTIDYMIRGLLFRILVCLNDNAKVRDPILTKKTHMTHAVRFFDEGAMLHVNT